MSIVGNRPIPLYEAEKLTDDSSSERFLAPSGLTGLWQISKRGQAEMSIEERKELDNSYYRQQSFWGDIVIILKTIPAMLQKGKRLIHPPMISKYLISLIVLVLSYTSVHAQ